MTHILRFTICYALMLLVFSGVGTATSAKAFTAIAERSVTNSSGGIEITVTTPLSPVPLSNAIVRVQLRNTGATWKPRNDYSRLDGVRVYLKDDGGRPLPKTTTGTNYMTKGPGSPGGMDYRNGMHMKPGSEFLVTVVLTNYYVISTGGTYTADVTFDTDINNPTGRYDVAEHVRIFSNGWPRLAELYSGYDSVITNTHVEVRGIPFIIKDPSQHGQ